MDVWPFLGSYPSWQATVSITRRCSQQSPFQPPIPCFCDPYDKVSRENSTLVLRKRPFHSPMGWIKPSACPEISPYCNDIVADRIIERPPEYSKKFSEIHPAKRRLYLRSVRVCPGHPGSRTCPGNCDLSISRRRIMGGKTCLTPQ